MNQELSNLTAMENASLTWESIYPHARQICWCMRRARPNEPSKVSSALIGSFDLLLHKKVRWAHGWLPSEPDP